MTEWEELERWAWRDGIELERLRRTWRTGKFVSEKEVAIEDIDWEDVQTLMRELGELPGIQKLYWHWGKAQLIRSGRVDWCQEAKDLVTVEEIGEKVGKELTPTDEELDTWYEILGPGTIANQVYGWS
jgi:hypothetical protein